MALDASSVFRRRERSGQQRARTLAGGLGIRQQGRRAFHVALREQAPGHGHRQQRAVDRVAEIVLPRRRAGIGRASLIHADMIHSEPLAQRRILVVEDEALLAELLCEELAGVGAVVVGPAATVQHALEMIAAEARLDAAILDVNLAGDCAEPVAVLLEARKVPVLLTTGYDAAGLPPSMVHLACWRKPSTFEALVDKLARLLASAWSIFRPPVLASTASDAGGRG